MPDSPQREIDTRAIEIASMTQQGLLSHEKSCLWNQNEIIRRLDQSDEDRTKLRDEMNVHMSRLYGFAWRSALGVISILVVAVGYFLQKFGLPGTPFPGVSP